MLNQLEDILNSAFEMKKCVKECCCKNLTMINRKHDYL